VDINDGLSDIGYLISGGPMELGGGSDTILEIIVEPSTTLISSCPGPTLGVRKQLNQAGPPKPMGLKNIN